MKRIRRERVRSWRVEWERNLGWFWDEVRKFGVGKRDLGLGLGVGV